MLLFTVQDRCDAVVYKNHDYIKMISLARAVIVSPYRYDHTFCLQQ
jgi:hypothetical protein